MINIRQKNNKIQRKQQYKILKQDKQKLIQKEKSKIQQRKMQYPLTPPIKSISKKLNQQNSQQTEDDLKPFSLQQLIDKQVDVDKIDTQQLVNYCHNQWKQWITSMIQLQQCITQENQTSFKIKTSAINTKHPTVQDYNNIQLKRGHTLTNEDPRQNIRQIPIYPATLLGKDFDNIFRPQNPFPIPQTSFMSGSLGQTGMTMEPSHHHQFTHNPSIHPNRNPFAFPFPQDKSIIEGFSGGFQNSSHFNQSIKMNFPNQDQSKNDGEETQRKQ